MIIWGGNDGNQSNSGGRYNPNTDGWTGISSAVAPSARSSHTAVWTGDEMIVWGGYDGATEVNTGGRYDPSADSWTATGTINAPTPRDRTRQCGLAARWLCGVEKTTVPA